MFTNLGLLRLSTACYRLAMLHKSETIPRNGADTRARIIEAAQIVFSEKGYPHAGLREIASRANVAASLVMKYFKSKSNLFEQALAKALIPPEVFQADRSRFGQAIVESVLDPNAKMMAPAMIALSLGDDEGREVAVRVAREHIIAPMAEWLGPEQGDARAINVLMMTTGFAILSQRMPLLGSKDVQSQIADLFAASLQAMVDGTT